MPTSNGKIFTVISERPPKLPAIAEAYFIHYLDNYDAKMYTTLT